MSATHERCPHCPMGDLGCSGHVVGNRAICRRLVPGHPYREVTIERQRELAVRYGWTAEKNATAIEPELQRPGLIQRAANLAGAVVVHAAAGFPQAEPSEVDRRLTTCRACEQFDSDRCKVCGCHMLVKATWVEQKCPLGKWAVFTEPAGPTN